MRSRRNFRQTAYRWLPIVAIGLVLVLAIVLIGEEVSLHMESIKARIGAAGLLGYLLFLALFVVTSCLLIPESLLTVTAGAVFGVTVGSGLALVGNLLAAALQYLIAHRLLHRRVQRWIDARPRLSVVQLALKGDSFKVQLLLRLTPVNPASLSYLLGANGVAFWPFLLAVTAILPHVVLEAYGGYAAGHLVRFRALGEGHALDTVLMLLGLAAVFAAVAVTTRLARRAIRKAAAIESKDEPLPE
jgi:uncharacterized membrane protein YdjX (TVP38/TMEM64 family)